VRARFLIRLPRATFGDKTARNILMSVPVTIVLDNAKTIRVQSIEADKSRQIFYDLLYKLDGPVEQQALLTMIETMFATFNDKAHSLLDTNIPS
jgi:hypothetical protein